MSEHPERWLSELYRASAREEPPRSLDAAILDAARKRSHNWLSRLITTWQAPLAAAAVIVIAVTVVIAVHEDPAYTEQSTLRGSDSKSAAEAKETPSSSAEYLSDMRAPPAAGERPALAEPKRQTATNRVQSGAEQQASAMTEKEGQKKAAATVEARKSEASERDAGTPLAAAGPAAPPRPAAPALERAPDVPAPVRENAPAQSAPPPPAAKALGKLSSASEAEAERRAHAAPESNQAPYRMRQDAASVEGARRAESRAATDQTAPEVWLENILKLRTDGRHTEAKESLAAFKKRYPDYPLPAVLKDL